MTQSVKEDQPAGPILALDVGQKRVGAAVCDSLLISITQLPALERRNWKQLLRDVINLSRRFDARTVVIGLPLGLDGTKGPAAIEAERTAWKFAQSLGLPVYLQDERLTTVAAEDQLREAGHSPAEIKKLVDSRAAAIILADFIGGGQHRVLVQRPLT